MDILLHVPRGLQADNKEPKDPMDKAEAETHERLIPAHKVILTACSKYFEAKIKRWMNDGSAQSGQSDPRECSSEVIYEATSVVSAAESSESQVKPQVKVECSSLEDLEAAEACLRTMYLQESPLRGTPSSWDPDTSIAFLLKVVQWGDLWQAECVTGPCLVGLEKLTRAAAFKARHMNMLLDGLPDFWKSSSTASMEAWQMVKQACSHWLLRKFRDVHEVVTVAEVRHAFCGLCSQAVSLWAGLDDLFGCENDVAIALAHWSSAQIGEQGQGCSKEVFRDLSESLRVPHLTKTFRFVVLPTLPFFIITEQEKANLYNLLAMDSTKSQEHNSHYVYGTWKPARKGTPRSPSTAAELHKQRYEGTWSIAGDNIRRLTADHEQLGDSLYVKGFLWQPYVHALDGDVIIHVGPVGDGVIPVPGAVYAVAHLYHKLPNGSLRELDSSGHEASLVDIQGNALVGYIDISSPDALDSNGDLPIVLRVLDVQ